MASALGQNASLEDVDDEITLTRVRLESLNPADLDYEVEKQSIERDLESLYDLQRDMLGASSSNEHSDPQISHPAETSHREASGPSTQHLTPLAQRIAPVTSSGPHRSGSHLTTSDTRRHNTAGKRPLGDDASHYGTGLDDFSHRHSKRPSPAPSYPDTPDSDDLLQEADKVMDRLTTASGDPAARMRALARRRERERELLERANQAKRDEDFARSLQDGMSARPTPSHSASQTLFNANGTLRNQVPTKPRHSTGGIPGKSPWNSVPSSSKPTAQYDRVSAGPSASNSRVSNPYSNPYNSGLDGRAVQSEQRPVEPLTPDSDDSDLQAGTAEEFIAASASRVPRQSMPGAYAASPAFNQTPNAGTAYAPAGYNGYTAYQPGVHRLPGAYAVAGPGFTERVQQAMQAASQMLRQNPASGAIGGFQDRLSQLNDMISSRPTPYNQHTFIPPSGVGYPVYPHSREYIDLGDSDEDDFYERDYNKVYISDQQQREELNNLLDNIHHSDESDPALREPTPEALREELYPHQRIGLAWMKRMEEGTNKGGILADDMGLGKTIQALALMVSRPSQNLRRKTTLIIAPLALMRQWATEIKTKLKPGRHQLSVWIQHGPKKKTRFRDLREFDVVLTTFGSLAVEIKKLEKWKAIQTRDPNATPTARERLVLLADDSQWYRVIIDEAQCIKNRATKSSKAASQLKSTYRWCMTGTPMMNGIEDLYAQLRFLHIGPFDDWHRFRQQFVAGLTRAASEERRKAAMQKFQALLKAILLRRTKTSEIDGKPILQLPPRIVEVKHTIFSDDEREFYNGLEQRAQVTVNRYLREGTVMRHYSNILVLLLRLRQACCHPHLIKDHAQPFNMEGIPEEDRVALARQLAPAVIERIIETKGEFECPVCYDATENPVLMIPCGHDTCSECFAKITDPAAAIANGDDGNSSAKCPQCRGRADATKVIDYNTFKKVHQPELWRQEHPEDAVEENASDDSDEGDDDSDDSDTASEAGDESESETGSLNGFIVDDDVDTDDDDDLDRKPRQKTEKTEATKAGPSKDLKKPKKSKKSKKAKGKTKKKETVTLGELRKLAQRNKKSKQQYLRRLRREWITSAKIEKTMEILHHTDLNDPTEKTIIFSQFTSLLDLLEVPIDDMGYTYERYDGSMSAGMRADAVHNFMTKPECRVILVSLKAGNAGLNLTAASSVIILDPFWNPFVEEQAIDRAHRIGQRREVKVHRVLVRNTVEDRIIELQERKRGLIGMALDETASRDLSRLGVGQIRYLFGLGGSASATD